MNQAEKRFRRSAVLSVFVLLTVLLGIINGINFTMAARDADELTSRLSEGRGAVAQDGPQTQPFRRGGMGPMGPDAPDMNASLRFFTAVIQNGEARLTAFRLSAVTEDEALDWALSLQNETTGWTHGTYRYRVSVQKDGIVVTVIDQGRELLPAYRILLFSVAGTGIGVVLSWLVLRQVGRKLFAPLEEADRKQKRFLADAEKEFKLPLTVISADAELLERENGPNDQTRSIHRQVRKMGALVRKLSTLSLFEEKDLTKASFSLSDLTQARADRSAERFTARGLTLAAAVEPGIQLEGSAEALDQLLAELIENQLQYAKTAATLTLKREGERIRLTAANDADLPDGSCDQVFDRFTVLSNAPAGRTGLGLAYVKDTVRAHNGRCTAGVLQGQFTVQIDL